MESQPQNPELRINPENVNPCIQSRQSKCYQHMSLFYSELIAIIGSFIVY